MNTLEFDRLPTLAERIEARYQARLERLRRRDGRNLCPTCGQPKPTQRPYDAEKHAAAVAAATL